MRRAMLSVGLVIALALLSDIEALAQARTGQSSGLFGSRNVGGSVSGLNSGSRIGGATGGGQASLQNQNSVGQLSGNERFVRGNRQAGSFVGGDTNDVGRFVGGAPSDQQFQNQQGQNQQGQFGGGQGNQLNRNSTLQPRNQRRTGTAQGFQNPAGGASDRSTNTVKAQRVVAFETVTLSSATVALNLQRRLAKHPSISKQGPITVRVENRTAILQGSVASEHARALAGQLVMLEAGVSRVNNELKVAPPPERE